MMRCCDGDTYVLPNGAARATPVFSKSCRRGAGAPAELTDDRQAKGEQSWAVCCLGCDRCLAVVDGPREEVYADL